MIDNRRSILRNSVTQEEIEFMMARYEQTQSLYDIQEPVFDKFGTTIDHRTIGGIIKKARKKEGGKTPSH
jgi:hypothetical protein